MTLYTTNTCGVCPTVKQRLDYFKKKYETIDVTDDVDTRTELHRKYGAMTVPVLVGDDGDFMVGFNPAKLMSMIKLN